MKKLILLTGIAFLAVSCEPELIQNPDDIINFRTINGSTKLFQETDMSNIENLVIFGEWVDGGVKQSPNQFDFAYNKQLVRATNGGSNWSYEPNLYWPTNGVVNFYAYSPAGSVNVNNFLIDATKPVITYTNPDNYVKYTDDGAPTTPKKQEDFLVAATLNQNKINPGSGTVALQMYHALSQARFIARNTLPDVIFEVKEVRILNLDNVAGFDISVIGDGSGDYAIGRPLPTAWDATTTEDSKTVDHYALQNGGTAVPYRQNPDEYQGLGEAITIIPQMVDSLTGGIEKGVDGTARTSEMALEDANATDKQLVALKFSGNDSQGNELIPTTWAFFNIDLNQPTYNGSLNPAVNENRFVMGVRYTFVFTFDPSIVDLVPITFTVLSIDGWQDPDDVIILN